MVKSLSLSTTEREVLGQSLAFLWQRISEPGTKDLEQQLNTAWVKAVTINNTTYAVPMGLSMEQVGQINRPLEYWPMTELPLQLRPEIFKRVIRDKYLKDRANAGFTVLDC